MRKTTNKYYRNQHSDDSLKNRSESFISKWGVTAQEIARQEGVTTTTIHMRVMNYGSPWQRKKKPTIAERVHGKTWWELAHELNVHPQTIKCRLLQHGDAYYNEENFVYNRGTIPSGNDWRRDPHFKNHKEWLMPEHPDYAKFKAGGFNE